MALHESVLEEFGLAPLWVRRGLAVRAAGEAAEGVGADDPDASARVIDEPRAVVQGAADERGARSAHGESATRAEAAGGAGVAASRQPQADSFAADAPRQPRAPSPSPSRQPAPSAPSSRAAEPPSFDAPPGDDFAWFDDLPSEPAGHGAAHAPTEARREAPQPPAVDTLDWDALSERVAACERCRLCEKRTNTVFGVGDRNADWMLIGEAPGENEDRQGEPFVGQAGKLLDNMLRSLTLARDTNVYIANVIKCRPPGNRNPEPDEVARCEPYLQRQVALVKPKLIVALGRFAAQSLLKTDASISSLRGRVHEYEGVPVIVTYHPAYLLRSLPDKSKAWADLCLARDTWRKAGGVPQ
ncbi:uracil-DNA glycosylase [Paraburkholderia sp. D15]|uniref:uracil-DNA glycosylase family protein n=1 Tax=Paraburkholderia sp. D15 TaxID=2880218 RepID=UPI0024794078|nr:uracil-DNA glycosylase family protein [Paraburkholderia sp. D15]WGS48468.1 uracil-DNA glycosylase [Paraburkholderia sp. D15]